MFMHLLLFIVGAVFAIFLFRFVRRWYFWVDGYAGPPLNPLVDHLIPIFRAKRDGRQLQLFEGYANKYGRIFTVKMLGHEQAVITHDPDCVRYILSTNFDNYIKGKLLSDLIRPLVGFGIFNSNGDRWRHKRHVALQLFTTRRMRYMSTVFQRHIEAMTRVLDKCVQSGEELDLQDLLFRFTLDSICEIAFGKEIHSVEEGATDFSRAFDVAQAQIDFRSSLPLWVSSLLGSRRLDEALQTVDRFAYEVIAEKRKQPASLEQQDLISAYLLLTDPETGLPFEDEYLRDVVMNFLIAGRDTTASTLTWAFFMLMNDRHIEAQCLEEIARLPSSTSSTDLPRTLKQHLPYTTGLINEALRLYPPVPFDPKHAVRDDVLPSGQRVRAGMAVVWSAYLQGRDAGFWPNPLKVDPTRWTTKTPDPWKFTPFQAGPRTCLGINMAMLEIKQVLTTILPRYRFTLRAGFAVEPVKAITVSANLLPVTVQLRE